ncbi:MAG: hypothetical protein P8I82_02445 [Flavobacteriales bacterium]|nr:hypothetical protein [Flavobacteriales bacterium]
MKRSISNLIDSCSVSVLTPSQTNSLRGGRCTQTWSKTDENSDTNGDGIPDDCNNEPDDGGGGGGSVARASLKFSYTRARKFSYLRARNFFCMRA